MGDLTPKPNTQGKVAQTDYDFWLTQSEDTCLYCLSARQIAILLTALPMSEWRTRWFSPTGATPDMDLIRAEVAKIETELMTNHCDLETAINNINTQITTINSTLVTVNADITTINNNLTIVQNNLTIVQQNVVNVYNQNTNLTVTLNIPDQTFSSDSHDITATTTYARYNAFCKIVTNWMLSEAAAEVWQLSAPPTTLNDILNLIDAWGKQVYSNITAPSTPYTYVQIHDAFVDSAALNDVACYIIGKIATLAPSYQNFVTLLTGASFPAYPDHRAIIQAVILSALNYLDGFNAFMSLYTPAYEAILATNPTGFYCPPCTPSDGCVVPATYDFTLGQKGPWLLYRGKLIPGTGIIGVTTPYDPSNTGYDLALVFPNGCAALHNKGIIMTANHLNASVGNAWTLEFWSIPTGGGTPTKYSTASAGPSATYPAFTTSARLNISPPTAGNVLYEIRWYINTGYYGNATQQPCTSSTLQKIQIVP